MILKKSQKTWFKDNLVSYTAAAVVLSGFIFGAGFLIKEYFFYSKDYKNFQRKYRTTSSLKRVRQEQEGLRQQSVKMEQMINGLKRKLNQMESQFAPLSPGTYEQNKLLILDLAMSCGLNITVENMPEHKKKVQRGSGQNLDRSMAAKAQVSGKTFLERYPQGPIYKRPVLRFKARSEFAGVLLFFRKLQDLQWQVTPIKFAIERKEETAQGDLQGRDRYNSNNFKQKDERFKANTVLKHAGDLELTVLLAL